MPIPRRFDRTPPERDSTRINERIRVPQVRLIDENGKQVGVIQRDDALRYAQERDLDLVEVAADARPPVCRVLDYSKYKYEQEQKAKAARKHQQQVTVREMKLRPKIAQNDYETKRGHVRRFLSASSKVKVTIMFRGREVSHPERGEMLLNRLAEDVADLGAVEQRPQQDGRNMTMLLGPVKQKIEAKTPDASQGQKDQGKETAPDAEQAKAPEADAEQPKAPEAEAEQPKAPEAEAEQPDPQDADAGAPDAAKPEAEKPAAEQDGSTGDGAQEQAGEPAAKA